MSLRGHVLVLAVVACDSGQPGASSEVSRGGSSLPAASIGDAVANVSSPSRDGSPPPAASKCREWEPKDPCARRSRPRVDAVVAIRAIRDEDDRMDFYCLDRPGVRVADVARINAIRGASAAIVYADRLEVDPTTGANTLRPPWARLGDRYNLCADEVFVEQPLGSVCSSVLLADGRVLTVRHCVEDLPRRKGPDGQPIPRTYDDLRFVFGYAMQAAGSPGTFTFPAGDVCRPKPGTSPVYFGPATKVALVEIECPPRAEPRTGVEVATERPAPTGADCNQSPDSGCAYALGYPLGMPAKFSGWARVTRYEQGLSAQLDLMHGNSGSPVIVKYGERHRVAGVVEGDGNFWSCKVDSGCERWSSCGKRCTDDPVIFWIDAKELPPVSEQPRE